MRYWTPPAKLALAKPADRATARRYHHDCVAALFMIIALTVFIVAMLCAFGVVDLLG